MAEYEPTYGAGYPVPEKAQYTVEAMVLGFHPGNTALQPIVENGLLRPQVIDAITAVQLRNIFSYLQAISVMSELKREETAFDDPAPYASIEEPKEIIPEGYVVMYEEPDKEPIYDAQGEFISAQQQQQQEEKKVPKQTNTGEPWSRWEKNPRLKTPRGPGRHSSKNQRLPSSGHIFSYKLPY